ncbi:hypothetical protein [Owenweeksia hongkongensis]|uniref:hypothetical protein n=1 Tax=Owenweeksia hongkongensis TaxID=253245 RepID=UPI0005A1AFFE|nr:hypothetical protein [Owenweeksia hongkongensis]
MEKSTRILDYIIHWKSKDENGFIGELMHIVVNSSGGSLSTPVGFLFGFREQADEYIGATWRLKLQLRDNIVYNKKKSITSIFKNTKKADTSEDKISESINPDLILTLKKKLVDMNFCTDPLSITAIIGQETFMFTNIIYPED